MDTDKSLDDLDLSDSENSSSSRSSEYISRPFTFGISQMANDDRKTEADLNTKLNPSKIKVRKTKKKKRTPNNESGSAISSSSASDVGAIESVPKAPLAISDETAKEEFFDAHESYHGIRDNQSPANSPVAGAALVMADSGLALKDPQAAPLAATGEGISSETTTKPSIVTKPVGTPELLERHNIAKP